MPALNPGAHQEILDLKNQLEKSNDVEQTLNILYSLFNVHITTANLQTTLIGKTVNALRNDESVGMLARSLIRKWKNIVINEVEGPESDTDMSDSDSCNSAMDLANDELACSQDVESDLIELCKKATVQIRLVRLEKEQLPPLMKEIHKLGEEGH